jgi:hypothetical protein
MTLSALDQASCHLVGLGMLAKRTGHPRCGGMLLLLSALGYVGLLHERIASAKLTGYRHGSYRHLDLGQLLVHAALGLTGYDWLTHE